MLCLAPALILADPSNMNCSVYPRLSVPGDMVGLINLATGNDSHVEYGTLSNFDYTVACKSNITTLGYGCSNTYVNAVQLYSSTDAHVSIDNYYPNQVCLNTSNASLAWYTNISDIGFTPSDYECLFAIAKYNDSHVYDCDNTNATYNVNIKINETINCFDTDADGAYNSTSHWSCLGYRDCDDNNVSLLPPRDNLIISSDKTLCNGTYYLNDPGSDGVIQFGADAVKLVCNNTILVGSNSDYGIFVSARNNVTIQGCTISNYSIGIEMSGGANNTLDSDSVTNSTLYGVYLNGVVQSTLKNLSIFSNSNIGLLFEQSSNNTLMNDSIYGNSGTGISFYLNCKNNSVNTTYLLNNGNSGISLTTNSDTNRFSNNTVQGNSGGLVLSSSVGNLFYFNNFVSNTGYHASADIAGNYFNTTNGSSCGNLCARGNFWDDISTIDIFDTNSDSFGDSGAEYPYNSTYSSKVTANVTDWGPITTVTDTTPPTGSIIIVGINGTDITGSRSVFLNLTYADNIAIGKCRWANDNESNLTSALWEECTTVKPWVLSEGEGNKTVYYEVMDWTGNTATFNDSILYRFMQDYTPPSSPVVYDSNTGHDIDWSNDNTTLSAYWFNATDDISTLYYKYRILKDSSCYNGDCNWTDVGESTDVVVGNFSLIEGSNYSFQVFAYISSGLNSSIATSNGSRIDLTRPNATIINSTTHPDQSRSYSNSTVLFNFTASDSLSGIDGYSYVIDSSPGTAPDDNVEDRSWFTLNLMANGGYEQLLRQNTPSANTYAVYSQLKQNFTAGDMIKVRVALAENSNGTDDMMGVKVYLFSMPNGAVTTFDNENNAIGNIVNISRDLEYSDNPLSAHIYEFDILVNSTINDINNDTYVAVTGITGDNDNRNNLSIAASNISVDSSTASYVCQASGACADTSNTIDYAIDVQRQDAGSTWHVEYDDIPDGTYYFHVKAKDKAGNWGDASHYQVNIDTGGISVNLLAPITGQLFSNPNITAVVEASGQANVTVIAIHPDGSNSTSDYFVFSGTHTFNVTLENGTNEVYAVAVNPANGVVTYSQSAYVILGLQGRVGNRTLRVSYSGALGSGHMRYTAESGAVDVGIAVENDGAIFGSDNIESDTSTYSMKIFATTAGMDSTKVESDLADDDFLDRVSPMFGYEKGVSDYVVRTEVRFQNAYLEGDKNIGSGKYNLIFKNIGVTPDGKTNISVRIV